MKYLLLILGLASSHAMALEIRGPGGGGSTSASDLTSGTLPNERLDSTSVTLQGNHSPTFTGTVTGAAFSGPLTGNVTGDASGNAGTATALAADPSDAPSGQLCRGVTAAGVCENARVDTAGV